MRLVYFGSGAFGLPTLRRLAAEHEIALVVTQPDRPAGRHRAMTPTPIAEFAAECGLSIVKSENVNDPIVTESIRSHHAEAFVVIAFGQKMATSLLRDTFAFNLHGSLLPKYRGAGPIQWAMIECERETGVSVIGVAERMDAGPIYGQAATAIDPLETAGELHDRLAELGPQVMIDVLAKHEAGRLIPEHQDERLATRAPKLSKSDGTVRFDQPAERVRCRIHGLTPWPGCTVKTSDEANLKLIRVQVADEKTQHDVTGTVQEDLTIACAPGSIRLLEVQAPGGKVMAFEAYRSGHKFVAGMRLDAL